MKRKQDLASHRLLSLTEEELSRIILDIHDGPVHYLFTALSLLTRIQNEIAQDPERADLLPELAQVGVLLESSLYEIKFFLGTFRPPEFHRRALLSVLQGLVIQHEERTGNTVELTAGELPDHIALPVKIALYRILQEALSNAYRHAHVDRHWVRLWSKDGCICMEVVDRGQGFEPPSLDELSDTLQETHIGLRGMRDRVALLGGEFQLFSRPGEGTRILVEVPASV